MITTTAETEFVAPALIRPRSPRIARQLAWCCAGLGHMYSGSLVRALWIMTAYVLPLCVGVVALCTNHMNWSLIVVCFAISLSIQIWSVWDAIQLARRTRPDYRLKDYNRISAYLLLFLMTNLPLGVGLAAALVSFVGGGLRFTNDFPSLGFLKGDQVFSSKLAYRYELPVKNDRVVFRFIPTRKSDTPGVILAVAGESITTNSGTTVVPPDQVWLRYQDNTGKNHDRLVSSYAIGGKIVFRYWPLSRFGEIPTGTPN